MGAGHVELAAASLPLFHEHLEGREGRFAAAYEDGVERLESAVEAAARGEPGRVARLSAGLRAGLAFLAASPALAHLLLVESLAAGRPFRLEHERTLARLAGALRLPAGESAGGGEAVSEEAARLLAGGLASHLAGCVLAGEAERLPDSHDLLLGYLLAPVPAATSRSGPARPAQHG